jgi:xanthine dehydrogenase accessory factor
MATPSPREYVRALTALVETGRPCAVATVISVDGSASARPGSKAIINEHGERVFGWVGGGCAETTVADEALQAIAARQPRMLRLDLEDEVLGVGMPCGGFMDLYIEPVLPQSKLVILGHGVIAETLAALGRLIEFDVTVNDPLATPESFPSADLRITADPDYAKVDCDGETYVVITTQHKSDYQALASVLRQDPVYVGLVASRKRSALLFERLHEDGFSAEALRRISAPCGLDIGADTPQEIALSIFSEILQRRNGGSGSGRPLAEVKGVAVSEEGVEIPDGPITSDKCPS